MFKFIAVVALLLPVSYAHAYFLDCKAKGVDKRPDLEDARVEINMDTAETTLYRLDGQLTLNLITSTVVSQYLSPRSSCQYKVEIDRHTKTGEIYEIAHKFATCSAPTSDTIGTVFAQVDINLEKMAGVYTETLLQLGPKAFSIPLKECVQRP